MLFLFLDSTCEVKLNEIPQWADIFLCFYICTASHLPYNRNGLKFFTNDGGLNKKDISDILTRADKIYHVMSKESTDTAGAVADKVAHSVDYMEQYTADLVEAVRKGAGGIGELQNFCLEDILKGNLEYGFKSISLFEVIFTITLN
jgi:phosphoglucomutase